MLLGHGLLGSRIDPVVVRGEAGVIFFQFWGEISLLGKLFDVHHHVKGELVADGLRAGRPMVSRSAALSWIPGTASVA